MTGWWKDEGGTLSLLLLVTKAYLVFDILS